LTNFNHRKSEVECVEFTTTVRGIALRNSIAVASTHYILTKHVYDMWVQLHMKWISRDLIT